MSGASVRDVRVAFLGLTSKLIAKRQSVSLKKYEKEIKGEEEKEENRLLIWF